MGSPCARLRSNKARLAAAGRPTQYQAAGPGPGGPARASGGPPGTCVQRLQPGLQPNRPRQPAAANRGGLYHDPAKQRTPHHTVTQRPWLGGRGDNEGGKDRIKAGREGRAAPHLELPQLVGPLAALLVMDAVDH